MKIRLFLLCTTLALLSACSTRSTDATPTTAEISETSTTSGMTGSTQNFLESFAESWVAGDWEGMSGLADGSAIATAQSVGTAQQVNVVWLPTCQVVSMGSGSCELLVTPQGGEGPALIFAADYQFGDGGLLILALRPGGDAG